MQQATRRSPHKGLKLASTAAKRYEKGKLKEARKVAIQLLDTPEADANILFQVGVAAYNTSDISTSILLYERALAHSKNSDFLTGNILTALGSSYSAEGNHLKAIEAFDQALHKNPEKSGTLNNRALALTNLNRNNEALTDLKSAFSIAPENAGILLNLGKALIAAGENEKALKLFEDNLPVHSNNPEIHIAIADIKKAKKPLVALKHYRKAAHLAPQNDRYLNTYANIFEYLANLKSFDGLNDDLLLLLSSDNVMWNRLNKIVPSHIKSKPAFTQIQSQITQAVKTDNDLKLDFGLTTKVMADNLLIAALKRMRIVDPELERLLELFRRQVLTVITSDTKLEKPLFDLLQAILIPLAHYCFTSEYVFAESNFENRAVGQLMERLESSENKTDEETVLSFLILCCYRQPHRSSKLTALANTLREWRDHQLNDLITVLLDEPNQEQKLHASIPVLTPINDKISLSVKEQYEENPYPRWHHFPKSIGSSYSDQLLRTLPSLKGVRPDLPVAPDVLIAGCGTGRQPISTALAFPETKVTAVDLSMASIAYALRKTNEMKIKNIIYGQADIMELETLNRKFNIIECAGVLHHMNDPVKGWQVLCNILHDDGFMLIGLYSELGRQEVIACREYIADNNYGDDVENIRQCRKDLLTLDNSHPASRITQSSDFYTTSACRDLIFHVQEHRFTIPQISSILDELGLEFLGFRLDRDHTLPRYKEHFTEDMMCTNLDNWHQFEKEHPETFSTMYKFWVRKKR